MEGNTGFDRKNLLYYELVCELSVDWNSQPINLRQCFSISCVLYLIDSGPTTVTDQRLTFTFHH